MTDITTLATNLRVFKTEDFWLLAVTKGTKMRQKPMSKKDSVEKVVRDNHCETRRHHSAEEKIRIVIDGLRGKESIVALF